MSVNHHSLEFQNAPPLRTARVAISISVTTVEELLKDRSGDLAPALPGIPHIERLVLREVVKTALYGWQASGKDVCASLGISNIAVASEPETVIIATKLRLS